MRKSAIDRLTANIANGRLTLVLASGVRADLALPTRADDLAAIAALRAEIADFGRKNDLTKGQIYAAYKTLTEHGYYVAGPQSHSKRAKWLINQLTEEQRKELLRKISK